MYTIVVTDDCNLRCSYCYEKDKKNTYMNKGTADKAIEFWIENIDDEHRNRISLHGGEPFLNFDVYKYLVKKIRDISENIIIDTTSNGTILNDEIIRLIKYYDINISISLDGDERSHNINRKFKNESDSYDIVMKNIERMVNNKIYPRIRTTLSKKNLFDLTNFIKNLVKIGINKFSFSYDIYESNWGKKDIIYIKDGIEKLCHIFKNTDVFVDLIDGETLCTEKGDCFGGITSFAISPNGDIFPCTFSINNKNFVLGNVFNKKNNSEIYNNIMNQEHLKLKSGNKECIGCEAIKICKNSMCKILCKLVNDDYNEPVVSYCMSTYFEIYAKNILKGI